jgi:benzoyl-CoA reductase subunit D
LVLRFTRVGQLIWRKRALLNTVGIDVGSSAVKVAAMSHPLIEEAMERRQPADPMHGQASKILSTLSERLRKRDPHQVARQAFERALKEAGVTEQEVVYIATTGEAETLPFKSGYFFGMTAHSRGAHYLSPAVRSVLDVGALHARVMIVDDRSRVLKQRMTGQCASGSGQFLENISRYLGVTTDEIGGLSLRSTSPEMVSGICAVLAETDVINMVSRGIATEDILKGIHLSLTNRLAKLFRSAGASFPLMLTGGLSKDAGLIKTLEEEFAKMGEEPEVKTHEHSVEAGAIGAALWGAFRYHKSNVRSGALNTAPQSDEMQLTNGQCWRVR